MTDSKETQDRAELDLPQPSQGNASQDPLAGSPAGDSGGDDEATEMAKWQQLKDLLVGHEEQRIEQLESKPPKAQLLAEVLPDAVLASSDLGNGLAEALRPTVEKGLLASARKNPDELAEAIYPVLGPAIRRSIRAALQSSMQSLNVALENSFSPQGIRWRMQAWRTGKSFSEVVMLHSLEYRVEQVYWIHKETGVLLKDVSRDSEGQKDPDMVSGMLAAIQDFVQDSFQGAEEGELEQIEVSGHRVLLAQGHSTGLALLVRGIPPEELSEDMHTSLESLHRRYGSNLDGFNGDVAPFQGAGSELEGLLEERTKEQSKRGLAPYALAGALALLLVFWLWSSISQSRLESRRSDALELLAAEPGYFLHADPEEDHWKGLRDPMARPLPEVLGDLAGKLDMQWSWQPFQSLESEMVLGRALSALQAPASVQVSLQEDRLVLAGRASREWVQMAKNLAPNLPGVTRVDHSALLDQDREAIDKRVRALNGRFLPFGNGSSSLDRAQPEVRARLDALQELDRAFAEYGGFLQIQIVAVAGQEESYDRGLLGRRLREVYADLSKLPLSNTIISQRPEPAVGDARMSRPGVRLELRPLFSGSH